MAPVVHGNPSALLVLGFSIITGEIARVDTILEEKASRRGYGVRFPPNDPIFSSGIRFKGKG